MTTTKGRMGAILGTLLFATAFGGTGLFAQSGDGLTQRERELMDTVKRLEGRVNQLEKERELDRNADAFETQVNNLASNMAAVPDTANLATSWSNGFGFTSDDKAFKLKITGRMQLDAVWSTQSDDLKDDPAFKEGLGDGFRFRRQRMGIQGEVMKHYEFKFEWDFAQGDADSTDVYMGVVNLGDFLYGVRVGQFKEPMGLDEVTSDGFLTFSEQAAAISTFVPGRNSGLMAYGGAFEERMTWALGVFRDTDKFGDNSGNSTTRVEDGKYAVTARFTGLPIYEDKGETLLHLGASVRYQNPGKEELRFQSTPENRIYGNFIDTGTIGADDLLEFGVEAALVWGPFALKAEFIGADVSGNTSANADPFFWGWYAEISYFLTGEHLPYNTKRAVFERVKPNATFLNEDGGLGAWQLALRFDQIDLSDDGVTGGEMDTLTFAVNWYLTANAMIRFDFSWVSRDDVTGADFEGDGYIFATRFQFDF